MNSTQARTAAVVVAFVACSAAVAVAQAMHHHPVQATDTATSRAAHRAVSGDASVPDAATVFAAMPEATVEGQAPTF